MESSTPVRADPLPTSDMDSAESTATHNCDLLDLHRYGQGSESAADDRMVGPDKRARTLWSDICGESAPTTFRTRASKGDDIIPTPASIPLEAPRPPVAHAPLLTGEDLSSVLAEEDAPLTRDL